MQTFKLGLHTAHPDPFTGQGLMVLPRTCGDVWLGPDSVHGADWGAAIRRLDRMGWELCTDVPRNGQPSSGGA